MGVNLLTHGQVNITNRRLRRRSAGDEDPRRRAAAPDPAAAHRQRGGEEQMMMLPAVTLLGFLVLTALVIAMGTRPPPATSGSCAPSSPPVGATPSPSRWVRSPPDRTATTSTTAAPLPPSERAGRCHVRVTSQSQAGGVSSTVRSSDSSRSSWTCTFGSSQRQKYRAACRLPSWKSLSDVPAGQRLLQPQPADDEVPGRLQVDVRVGERDVGVAGAPQRRGDRAQPGDRGVEVGGERRPTRCRRPGPWWRRSSRRAAPARPRPA